MWVILEMDNIVYDTSASKGNYFFASRKKAVDISQIYFGDSYQIIYSLSPNALDSPSR